MSNWSTGWQSQALGMLGGNWQAQNQYDRQRRLMGLQNRYQQALNQQGHDLQFDMWNKTNYGAQVKHMLEAGLNPALMYGSAGQGGTTGSQGGGQAGGGQAASESVMDLGNMLVQRQGDLLKAQTAKANAEAAAIAGYKKDESVSVQNKLAADKFLAEQQLSESKQRELNLKTENEIKEHDRDYIKKHNISTYDIGIIRGIKAGGLTIGEALNEFKENGGSIKKIIKGDENWETGMDSKGEYMIDKRTGKKVYY